MKSLIASIAIIVGVVIFFVVFDYKDFNRSDDIQTVQGASIETKREPSLAPMMETNSATSSPTIETESGETRSAETTPVVMKLDENESNKAPFIAEPKSVIKPAAMPILSPAEADEANKEALRDYRNKKNQRSITNFILITISVLSILVLMSVISLEKIKHLRFLQIWDYIGGVVTSFIVMYCVLFIFQINRPGFEFLTTLQPILTSPSLHLFLITLVLFALAYIKFILPYLLKCNIYFLFAIELLFSILVGIGVIYHFSSAELVSDFKTISTYVADWQTLTQDQINKKISAPGLLAGVFARRCYYSYYMLYKIFGCHYIVIELSQLFMHLALGINVYFLAKQCILHEKMARLSMILYFFMPAQYLYLTVPSLDIWGGMLLCFNANMIIYLFKKSPELCFYKKANSVDYVHDSLTESKVGIRKIRSCFHLFAGFFQHIPWLLPLLVSILLGITLFWMEMVRNLQLILCIPMFLFLSAVVVRRILVKKMKFFSRTMLFICVLCLLIPFLSNKMTQILCNAASYGSDGIPDATLLFNSPDEVREVIRWGDFGLAPSERRKDFALDAAVTYWNLYPSNYSRFFGTKMGYFSDLFNSYYIFIANPHNLEMYPQEFSIYSFLVWIIKIFFLPLLLIGILCVLFYKRWNSLAFIPIVLFAFFFILMPTVGQCQSRYTSVYYAPMCVCAACVLLINPKKLSLFGKKKMRTRFLNSVLWGVSCIIILLFAITSFFSNSTSLKKHLWINFQENERQLSSGDFPVAYKKYTERNYLLSSVFQPVVVDVIPEKTFVEWTIPEQTTEGHEYILYGFLIAPQKNNADFIIRINDSIVWENNENGKKYSSDRFRINNEKIYFLDNLKFTAEKENILRVEITPKNKENVDFALSAWGMVPCK